jgi:hypothetical protein
VAEGAGFDFATDQSGSRMIFCMTGLAVAPVKTSAGGAEAGGYSGHRREWYHATSGLRGGHTCW